MIKETVIEHDVCQDLVFEKVRDNICRVRNVSGDTSTFFEFFVLTLEQARRAEEIYEKTLHEYEKRKSIGMLTTSKLFKLP